MHLDLSLSRSTWIAENTRSLSLLLFISAHLHFLILFHLTRLHFSISQRSYRNVGVDVYIPRRGKSIAPPSSIP